MIIGGNESPCELAALPLTILRSATASESFGSTPLSISPVIPFDERKTISLATKGESLFISGTLLLRYALVLS